MQECLGHQITGRGAAESRHHCCAPTVRRPERSSIPARARSARSRRRTGRAGARRRGEGSASSPGGRRGEIEVLTIQGARAFAHSDRDIRDLVYRHGQNGGKFIQAKPDVAQDDRHQRRNVQKEDQPGNRRTSARFIRPIARPMARADNHRQGEAGEHPGESDAHVVGKFAVLQSRPERLQNRERVRQRTAFQRARQQLPSQQEQRRGQRQCRGSGQGRGHGRSRGVGVPEGILDRNVSAHPAMHRRPLRQELIKPFGIGDRPRHPGLRDAGAKSRFQTFELLIGLGLS